MSFNNSKLLSIIIPVYNTGILIREFLAKFLKIENKEKVEIILIDDVSSDNSQEICRKYSKKYENIVFFPQDINRGPGICRNKGIEMASGEFYFFMDSDDKINLEKLNDILVLLRKNPNIDMFCFTKQLINTAPLDQHGIITVDSFLEKNSGTCMVPMWNWIFNKKLILENNIRCPKSRQAEDYCFVTEALMKAKTLYGIDMLFYNYIKFSNTSTSNNSKSEEKLEGARIYLDLLKTMKKKEELSLSKVKALELSIKFIQMLQLFTISQLKDESELNIEEKLLMEYISKRIKEVTNNFEKSIYICPTNDISIGLARFLEKLYGKKINAFLDNNADKKNPNVSFAIDQGYDVLDIKKVLGLKENKFIFIASRPYIGEILEKQILKAGLEKINDYYDFLSCIC